MNEHLETLRADVTRPFTAERFSMSRLPVHVGTVTEQIASPGLPCCLDMLVKVPDGELLIPEPYASNVGIDRFLVECLKFQDDLLPAWRVSHYAYLTVDYRNVGAGSTHRNAGWHMDGMQGTRYPIKLDACHQYIVADRIPTEFTDAPTDATGLGELTHNWFVELGGQVPESHPVYSPKPFEIVAMSAYQLHRSRVAAPAEAGWRSFLRLDISLKQQDRLGNTPNPLLQAPFEYVVRNLPAGLALPISDTGWSGAKTFDGADATA